MNRKSDKPADTAERRGSERVADDADWETKVLARVRGRLKQTVADADQAAGGQSNWEQDVLKAMRDKLDKKAE